jgi:hypothetical protein
MFSNHVTEDLSAYCNGELPAEQSRQVAEHLIACNRCREEFDEIKLGVKLAECLPLHIAPESLWSDINANLPEHTSRAVTSKPATSIFKVWRPAFVGVAAGLLLMVAFGVYWVYTREARPFWEVARLNGTPRIGSSDVHHKGQLAVGDWLETDDSSRAQIEVASIGQVDIDPNTRVRLVETKPTEHRLELERGRMSARIWAPPRLFFVNTPSAVAADLGCAYTLEVDEQGVGLLHVTSGWVALQLRDRESMVPAGAACATRPGVGPGTPYFDDASQPFRQALAKFDFEPWDNQWSKTSTLDIVLHEARPRDTLTLWHLLERVEGSDRARVYDRLAQLGPPPDGVTRDGVLQLNEEMLQAWKDKLANTWDDQSSLRKAWINTWTRALGKIRGMEGKK